jgi:hypothetical protein
MELNMVCHSKAFVLAILQEKPYFHRLSDHLIEQILGLECDDFARLLRAIDAAEAGTPSTRSPGAFDDSGVLSGYGHFHYRQADWGATNLAATMGKPINQPLDKTIDEWIDGVAAGDGNPGVAVQALMKKFSRRIRRASGDWVLYWQRGSAREYLAISPHTLRDSAEERDLKQLLDSVIINVRSSD